MVLAKRILVNQALGKWEKLMVQLVVNILGSHKFWEHWLVERCCWHTNIGLRSVVMVMIYRVWAIEQAERFAALDILSIHQHRVYRTNSLNKSPERKPIKNLVKLDRLICIFLESLTISKASRAKRSKASVIPVFILSLFYLSSLELY